MEDEIRTLLHETAPQPSDPAAFRLELNARLSAVEQIKTYRDREYRRSRRTMYFVFAAGILLGVVLTALALLHPVELPDISLPIPPEGLAGRYAGYVAMALGAITAACAIVLPLTLTRHRSRFLDS
ncbi:MAG: hypothetical protein J6Y63_05415 [Bacteroidales bacterium]|nr:hypothetical protein [Bacteroidales bacterium]